jgi:hypothetical protein
METDHRNKAPFRIHNAIIMRQRKRTSAAKRMSRQARDRREWEIENRMQHGIKAICVCEGICVSFVEIETGAEEFGAVGGRYYGASGRGT